ncbi:MAG: hypothetical protein WC393_04305 [Candidatus Nanoarchaeia archaeon]|jgi:hypothetical protein
MGNTNPVDVGSEEKKISNPSDPDIINKPEDVVTYISTGKFQDSDNYKSLISSNKTELDKY